MQRLSVIAVSATVILVVLAPAVSAQSDDPYVSGTTVVTTSLPPAQPPSVRGETLTAPASNGAAPRVLAAEVSRPAAAQQSSGTLAFTGGDITTLAVLGLLLAVAGVSVLALRRRRLAL